MTQIIKNVLLALIMPLLTTVITAIGMDDKQIMDPTINQKKVKPIGDVKLQICANYLGDFVGYGDPEIHEYFQKTSYPTSLKDLLILRAYP